MCSSDLDEIRVAVNAVAIDVRKQVVGDGLGIFCRLAAGNEQWRAHELDDVGVRSKIFFNLLLQFRLRLRERIFQHNERFMRCAIGEDIAQDAVLRREDVFREENPELPADLDVTFDGGHDFYFEPRGGFIEF